MYKTQNWNNVRTLRNELARAFIGDAWPWPFKSRDTSVETSPRRQLSTCPENLWNRQILIRSHLKRWAKWIFHGYWMIFGVCQCESRSCHVMNRLRHHLRATLLLQLQLDSQQLCEALHQRSPNIFAKTSLKHLKEFYGHGLTSKETQDNQRLLATCKSYI